MTTQLPSVFIGSSTEGLKIARAVELQLVDENVAKVTLWPNGIFGLGEGTLESLMVALPNFDFCIMVLSSDDLLETRGKNYTSPRDNVLFELGLFMGYLGPSRTFILSEESVDLKLPSDLAGISRATYRRDSSRRLSAVVSTACTRIIDPIQSRGSRPRHSADLEAFLNVGMQTVHDPLTHENVRDLLARANHIKVLKTWFPESTEIESGLLAAIEHRARVELLLCKPDSDILKSRSLGAHEPELWGSYKVYHAVEKVYEALEATPRAKVEIACYDSWPGCPVIWYDGNILMGFYFRGKASPAWPWVSVKAKTKLAKILENQFKELWTLTRPRTVLLKTRKQMAQWLKKNKTWDMSRRDTSQRRRN